MRLLDILSEGKKSNVDWVKRLMELANQYMQGHDPEPLEKEAIEIMTWAYEFCKEYIPLMPDWLERAFKVYRNTIQEVNEKQIVDQPSHLSIQKEAAGKIERAEYEEVVLF